MNNEPISAVAAVPDAELLDFIETSGYGVLRRERQKEWNVGGFISNGTLREAIIIAREQYATTQRYFEMTLDTRVLGKCFALSSQDACEKIAKSCSFLDYADMLAQTDHSDRIVVKDFG